MAQQTIRFRIHSGGRVQELVEGMQGEGCQQLTERIEARLGSVQQRQSTSEAFLPLGVPQDTSLGEVPALTQVLHPSSANDTPPA
jgi:hypothetical protein